VKASTRTSSAKKAVKPVAKKAAAPVKTTKTAKTVAKPAAKSPSKPVGKAATKVPAKAVKPAAKPVAKKPVAKAPAKAPAKPVTKSPAKSTAKQAPAKKVAAPVRAAAAKTAKAVTSPMSKTTPKAAPKAATPKVAPAAPKAVAAKAAPAAPAPAVVAPPVAAPAPAPRKSSRAAKAASMVPPPPAPVVASNAAKSSYGPISTPSLPSFVPVIPKKDAKLANNWKTTPVEKLSDAEVLAMPDGEYMNDTQMAFFRLKLVQLKQDILANAGETTEHLREDTVIVPDPADRATIEEEHALELRTRDRERKLLKKIEQSISRIDAGDYGYCDETGEPIGVGRLLARPTATLSLEAQQRRELKQKMFGD
jgi:DnaK suppressor protein